MHGFGARMHVCAHALHACECAPCLKTFQRLQVYPFAFILCSSTIYLSSLALAFARAFCHVLSVRTSFCSLLFKGIYCIVHCKYVLNRADCHFLLVSSPVFSLFPPCALNGNLSFPPYAPHGHFALSSLRPQSSFVLSALSSPWSFCQPLSTCKGRPHHSLTPSKEKVDEGKKENEKVNEGKEKHERGFFFWGGAARRKNEYVMIEQETVVFEDLVNVCKEAKTSDQPTKPMSGDSSSNGRVRTKNLESQT